MTRYIIPPSPSVQCLDDGRYYSIPLSDREIQVIILLYRGLSHREIAAQLKISPFTVRNHVINIMDKIGIRTNVGIVTWYIDSILFIKYGSNFLSLAEEAIQ